MYLFGAAMTAASNREVVCPDINNIEKATTLVKQLRAIAAKHNIAIVATIHPNKGTDVIAGHLGAGQGGNWEKAVYPNFLGVSAGIAWQTKQNTANYANNKTADTCND